MAREYRKTLFHRDTRITNKQNSIYQKYKFLQRQYYTHHPKRAGQYVDMSLMPFGSLSATGGKQFRSGVVQPKSEHLQCANAGAIHVVPEGHVGGDVGLYEGGGQAGVLPRVAGVCSTHVHVVAIWTCGIGMKYTVQSVYDIVNCWVVGCLTLQCASYKIAVCYKKAV